MSKVVHALLLAVGQVGDQVPLQVDGLPLDVDVAHLPACPALEVGGGPDAVDMVGKTTLLLTIRVCPSLSHSVIFK